MGIGAILGSLAGGYAEGQTRQKQQDLEKDLQGRQLQSQLLTHLLSDPSTPSEYHGTIVQALNDTLTAKKIPNLADYAKSLPALRNPAFNTPGATPQAGAAPMPAMGIQLPLPPGSASKLAPGAAGPEPPPATVAATAPAAALPSQPVGMPAAPPPLAAAGTFHSMSPEEQQQIASQAAIAHAQAISQATGVPVERVLGLQPKYTTVPWGSTVIDSNTGKPIEGMAQQPKPLGAPIQFINPNDSTTHYFQRFEDPVTRAITTHEVTADGMIAKPITSMLPTETTGSSSYNADTGVTTTSHTTQKVLPRPNMIQKPAAPPSAMAGGSVAATPKAAGAPKAGGRVAAMADDWEKGIVPSAKDKPQVEAYMKANGRTPSNPFDVMAGKDAVAQSKIAAPMINLMTAQKQYMDGIDSGAEKASPRADLALVIAAVRAMNPGTVRLPNKEIELELQAGSAGQQLQRWYNKGVFGTLPDDQRKDLFGVISRETSTVAKTAAANWSQYMKGTPLPAYLTPYAVQTPNAPPTGDKKMTPEEEAAQFLSNMGKK